jgi:hypothetical protein
MPESKEFVSANHKPIRKGRVENIPGIALRRNMYWSLWRFSDRNIGKTYLPLKAKRDGTLDQ